MKVFRLIILLAFSSFAGYAQTTPWASTATTSQTRLYNGAKQIRWLWNSSYIYSLQDSINAASPLIPGGPASSTPSIGFNPGTNLTASAWIQAAYYQTNNPTGSLSGGDNYQRSATGVTHNLSYSYGRTNLNTNPIASAVINPGSFNVFTSSPTQGSSNSGTQSVTTAANTNTIYTITITTTDSKTASYSTTDGWYGNAYYGRAAGTSATSTEVLAAAGGGSPLVNSVAVGGSTPAVARANTWTVTASGSNHPFIAIPATLGHITQFLDGNGFNITSSFPETTVSITNASGYTENYYVYTFVTATFSNYLFVTN